MKNKDAILALALYGAIVAVAILSLFSENDLFRAIAKSLTIPLIVVAFVNNGYFI